MLKYLCYLGCFWPLLLGSKMRFSILKSIADAERKRSRNVNVIRVL